MSSNGPFTHPNIAIVLSVTDIAGVIKKSTSAYNFPLVIVSKKPNQITGEIKRRICVDFRQLNKVIKPVSFSIPHIEDLLAQVSGAKIFTSLDLKSGYHQIPLSDNSSKLTSFTCLGSKYEFLNMPFGLNCSGFYFQYCMQQMLDGLSFATAYIDDILIFSKTLQEHERHVQQVLDRLKKHGFKLKLSKCNFFAPETKYLGYVINERGITPDIQKVEVIKNLPAPTNVRECRRFIGMAGYYRRWIKDFSKIVEPIVNNTRKYARFKWNVACQESFDKIKTQLSKIPMVGHPDITKPFHLYTDASDETIGAVLCQPYETTEDNKDDFKIPKEKPIYFLSHKLSKSQSRYSVTEKECLAIVYALNKLEFYLRNTTFVIFTDHQPLIYILSGQLKNKRLQSWALQISSFNCEIKYHPGDLNICADFVSRLPNAQSSDEDITPRRTDNALEINAINSNRLNLAKQTDFVLPDQEEERPQMEGFDMVTEQEKDDKVRKIKHDLNTGKADKQTHSKFIVVDNVVYFISNTENDPKLRLYIPEHLQNCLLKEYHEFLGHSGVDRFYETLKHKYYFPNQFKIVYAYVDNCLICKSRNLKAPKVPMQETQIALFPFQHWHVDISGPFTKTLSNNIYVLSFVDSFSGWIEATPIPDRTALTITQVLLDQIIPYYSVPVFLTTDNGSEFVSEIFTSMLKELNIQHIRTSVYNPQGNARVERSHRSFNEVIAKKLTSSQDFNTWDVHIPSALMAIRFNISKTTKHSPFFLVFNRDPILPLDNLLRPRRKYLGEDFTKLTLQEMHKTFLDVYTNSKRAQRKQLKEKNQNTKPIDLQEGDRVFYRKHKRDGKFDTKWLSHYIIIEKTSPVSFKILNQITQEVTRAHARHLVKAEITWPDPKKLQQKEVTRPARKKNLAYSSSITSASSSETEQFTQLDNQLDMSVSSYENCNNNNDDNFENDSNASTEIYSLKDYFQTETTASALNDEKSFGEEVNQDRLSKDFPASGMEDTYVGQTDGRVTDTGDEGKMKIDLDKHVTSKRKARSTSSSNSAPLFDIRRRMRSAKVARYENSSSESDRDIAAAEIVNKLKNKRRKTLSERNKSTSTRSKSTKDNIKHLLQCVANLL